MDELKPCLLCGDKDAKIQALKSQLFEVDADLISTEKDRANKLNAQAAEIARLRAALEVFANEDNWMKFGYDLHSATAPAWISGYDTEDGIDYAPWEFAQKALEEPKP